MKEKITNNLSLKILSLIVAIFIWLLVINVDNPIITKTFVVTDVQLLNEAYIDADGKMCMRDEEQQPIRVTIKAKRKILDDISVMDIRAVADLQQAVSLDTTPVMVPITASVGKIPAENIQVSPQNLSLHIEDKETQEFVVTVTTNNTRPDKGYEIGNLISNPEKIRITGPTSLINKIDKVVASVNVNGAVADVTQETDVTVIDKNGEEFSSQDLNYLNVSKVYVSARLWKVRTDVKISAECSGSTAEGYQVESVTTTPNVISVAGSDEALSALAEQNNTIWIPADAIDISGKDKDHEEKINISEYLPEGLKLTSDSSEDVFVHVNILPQGSTVCEIPTKNIKVENMPKGMQAAFDAAQIEVRVKKTREDMDDLKEKDIKASIDLKDKEEGSYELPVKIQIPEGYELVDDVTTGVEVSEISTAEENS
ncbi:YbbR-like domain-containing protein [Blautia sp.]|uniref:YbbR-like protein n=1 Tax=Blautia glucerasea TaxID=536633 RepID=A0A6N2UHZ8_9FIRM|nr:CdaR family protein [uncultured Blautia sp.]